MFARIESVSILAINIDDLRRFVRISHAIWNETRFILGRWAYGAIARYGGNTAGPGRSQLYVSGQKKTAAERIPAATRRSLSLGLMPILSELLLPLMCCDLL
jgi:hypothetical protein